jgi:nitroreductase
LDNILDVIFKRRSIRVYQEKEVSRDTLKLLLQAAMAAPSAKNSRPWEFIAITEKDILDKFRARLEYGNYNAPAAIMVLANLKIAQSDSSIRFWVQDCSAAVENILIAAAGLGLGTVWIGSYPKADVIKIEQEILGIPESIYPLALIYVGYPGEEKPARTQYEESRVHWQRY